MSFDDNRFVINKGIALLFLPNVSYFFRPFVYFGISNHQFSLFWVQPKIKVIEFACLPDNLKIGAGKITLSFNFADRIWKRPKNSSIILKNKGDGRG